jgi:hypothetical protein
VRYLSRLGPNVIAWSVAGLATLTPVRGWTEELPERRVLDRPTLDNPWLASSSQTHSADAETCDPWNAASPCVEELSDPWESDALPSDEAPESVAGPAPPPSDLSFVLRGDEVRLEIGVDWLPRNDETSCVPESAEVHVRGVVGDAPVSAHHAGKVSPLDSWVIDLGVPEAPYE